MRLEREGTAEAFLDSEVVKAIQTAPWKMPLRLSIFRARRTTGLRMDWQHHPDRASAMALAETIRDTAHASRRTSVSSAWSLERWLIESSERTLWRRAKWIDVSGDGPNNNGNRMTGGGTTRSSRKASW